MGYRGLNTKRVLLADVSRSNRGGNCSVTLAETISRGIGVPMVTDNNTNALRRFCSTFARNGTSTILTTSLFRFNRVPVPRLGGCLGGGKVPMELWFACGICAGNNCTRCTRPPWGFLELGFVIWTELAVVF